MSERHGLPPHVFTDDPGKWDSESRLQVDVGQTGFWLGLQRRISYEFNIPNATTQVIKFDTASDFIIQFQSLSVDTGALRFRAFRSVQGTAGGTYGTTIDQWRVNLMSTTPTSEENVTLTTGGTFTPGVDELPAEVLRLRTSGATAQRTSVSGSAADERGLPSDVYYLMLENIAGSGAATGVFDLRWEERPATLGDWLIDEYGRYE